jgi:arginine decarboxylase
MNENSISATDELPELATEPRPWHSDQAKVLYNLDKWGAPYFTVNAEGHVAVRPLFEADTEIDIFEIIEEVKRRDIQLPVLIRFQDLLRRRVI